jgi:hypothetical protein
MTAVTRTEKCRCNDVEKQNFATKMSQKNSLTLYRTSILAGAKHLT